MAIYSVQLFAALSTTSGVTVFTAPSSGAIVIRDIEIVNATPNTDDLNIYTLAVSGFASAYIFKARQLPAGNWVQWHGRVVLEPNQGVQLYSGAAGWTVLASGYNLQ